MRKYTSIQLTGETRKKLFDLKFELKGGTKILSFEEIINNLLKIKNIIFILEYGGRKREINGTLLYDKLKQGWKLKAYKLK